MPDGKVVRARAVQPKPEGVPTTKASLDVIASGPAGGSVVMTQASSSPTKKAEDGTPGASEGDPVPRGFRVIQEVLDKVGFSKGCGRCEAIQRDDKEHKGHHTKECRKRVEERMKEDPEVKKKLSEVEAKQIRWLGRRVEAHDTRDKTYLKATISSTLSTKARGPRTQCRLGQRKKK